MANSEDLRAEFEPRGQVRGRILVLDPATAIELVAAAQAGGVRVLGVDGFRVSAEGIQPLQECDLNVEDAAEPYETTRTFLERFVGGDVMFEVALGGGE